MSRLPYKSFIRRDGPSNNTFYSFGGSKFIRGETEKNEHVLNPIFRDYDGKVFDQDVVVIHKFKNQYVSDYTKNISQSIFSPGELKNYGFVNKQKRLDNLLGKQKPRHRMTRLASADNYNRGKARKGPGSAQPKMTQKLDEFAIKLNEEARKKQKLRAAIDEIKSNMSMYQESMAGGRY